MDQVKKFIEDIASPVKIQIKVDAKPKLKFLKARPKRGKKVKLPIYSEDDSISGVICIKMKEQNDILEHLGIKCCLVGRLEIYEDQELSTEFHLLSKEMQPAGTISRNTNFKFKFSNFEKQYESYYGVAGEVHYFLRVVIQTQNFIPNITQERSFAVLKTEEVIQQKIEKKKSLHMDVGVNEKLNLEFQFDKDCFHLKDCIMGKVLFKKVGMFISRMELWIIKYEIFGAGKMNQKDKEVMIKYQIMDGCPEDGDIIPIRLFLHGIPKLTPTYHNIHHRLSVKYGLNLVLIDQKGKKYFKQADIILYRNY